LTKQQQNKQIQTQVYPKAFRSRELNLGPIAPKADALLLHN